MVAYLVFDLKCLMDNVMHSPGFRFSSLYVMRAFSGGFLGHFVVMALAVRSL